jgi:hypothetical protein
MKLFTGLVKMFEEIVKDELINSGWTIIQFGQSYGKIEAVQKRMEKPVWFKFQDQWKLMSNELEIQYASRLCERIT